MAGGAPSRNGRLLKDEDDVWSHNAWDNVQWTPDRVEAAEETVKKQMSQPVSDAMRDEFNAKPAEFWNKAYTFSEKMYQDRSWLLKEFEELATVLERDAGPKAILELGCGPGNTAFPLLQANRNPNLVLHAADFSAKAIESVKANPAYDGKAIRAHHWDLSSAELPPELLENSIDMITSIFVLSALHPTEFRQAIINIHKLLKPGGMLLFRDFGRHDLCQLRFKKERWLSDNFYCRGDGTRVYFFTLEEIRTLMQHPSPFRETQLAYDRRLILNRKRQLQMFRCWVQGKFIAIK